MKYLRSIFLPKMKNRWFLMLMLFCFTMTASASSQSESGEVLEQKESEGGINLKEILFGHIQDSYQWHVTDIGGHPLIIPLPMIFYS